MNSERQRIKIAEACGFEPYSPRGRPEWKKDRSIFTKAEYLPDYLNDLNACHEMEQTLADAQHRRFRRKLAEISHDKAGRSLHSRALISATAAQRCEAFLKTLGLWEAKK